MASGAQEMHQAIGHAALGHALYAEAVGGRKKRLCIQVHKYTTFAGSWGREFRACGRGGAFLLLSPTASFLSAAKKGNSAPPAREGLRRVTFFSWRKKVTKERHLRKGDFDFPLFLKNLFP